MNIKLRPLSLLIPALFSGLVQSALAAPEAPALGEITVTGTREGELVAETPSSIGVIDRQDIKDTNPTHPSQILGQVPGVWVNVTGGEGHMTGIRQPLTTSPVYLYLEDGIPTRSTGFFNHNALYEINVPQAGGVEVTRGPGSALYGSDAIGGIVNVLTRAPSATPEIAVSGDIGGHGFKRLLATGSHSAGENGARVDLNLTSTDGWRDHTEYDRQSLSVRWDRAIGGDMNAKTVLTWSDISQGTAGSSTLSEADYQDNPTFNYTPISFRKVSALRLSSAIERESGDGLLSVTPYFRSNDMDLLANWSLNYDPTVYNTQNQSLGLLAKYRKDLPELHARLIFGVDLDYSPGGRLESSINTVKNGKFYTDYSVGQKIYDYDVAFKGVSPYVHGEISPLERLRLSAGLRFDHLSYDYDNRMSDADIVIKPSNIPFNITYRHPGDTDRVYTHLSPKLGATYAFTPALNGFVTYKNAFRAPSEGQLFRQGSALNTIDLRPVVANSYEIGLRGQAGGGIQYEASLYTMSKKDDILNYKDPVTGATQATNAGETLHQGLELGLGAELTREFRLDIAVSYAKHSYEDWVVSGTADYSGNEMEIAPRLIGDTRLAWQPAALNGGKLTLEWVALGSYWMDAANTQKYDGHDLLNVRVNYPVNKKLELLGSVMNLTDERYADTSSYTTSRGREFSPGLPRTVYAGLRYNLY